MLLFVMLVLEWCVTCNELIIVLYVAIDGMGGSELAFTVFFLLIWMQLVGNSLLVYGR